MADTIVHSPIRKLIQKTFAAMNYTGLVYWVHMCRNTTTKKDCYPEEKIKEILMNLFVIVIFTDYYLDHNRESVAVPYVYADNVQASISVYKRIFLYI
jgi:hypothetical protein